MLNKNLIELTDAELALVNSGLYELTQKAHAPYYNESILRTKGIAANELRISLSEKKAKITPRLSGQIRDAIVNSAENLLDDGVDPMVAEMLTAEIVRIVAAELGLPVSTPPSCVFVP